MIQMTRVKTALRIVRYLALVFLSLWLVIASIRVFIFTKNAEQLIRQVNPYQQQGDDTKSILFIGDSFAYGTGATTAEATLAGLVGAYLPDAKIVNKAKNGTKSADLASRLDADIDKRYHIIIVIVGANDILHPEVNLSSTRQAYKNIYETAAKNSDYVIAITSGNFKDVSFFLWPLNHYFGSRSQTINKIARGEAAQYPNITYIDAFDQSIYPSDPKLFESEDRLHPNDLGTHYWFKKIMAKTNNLKFDRS